MPKVFLKSLLESFYDLLPIILVIGFFQLAVLQQPIPNLLEILTGSFFVLIGLTLFVQRIVLRPHWTDVVCAGIGDGPVPSR
jgi:hypothetical protein